MNTIQYLQKKSNSDQSKINAKYFIPCKAISENIPTTDAWLNVIKQLQPTNFSDKSRILLGIMDKKQDVVIKIGESITLEKEYTIGNALFRNKIPGFIKYSCFFKCNDDYREHPSISRKSLCRGPGEQMSCLVMPYIRDGNMRNFDYRKKGIQVLKSHLKMAFKSLTKAYEAIGLVHNDTHAQNVLIIPKRTSEIDGIQCHGYGIAFMDFENSLISQDKSQRQFTYKDIARLVSDIHYTSELNLTGIVELIAEIEKHRSLNTVFDEASRHIFLKVDELNFSIQLPSKTLIYDPNVFFKDGSGREEK